MNKAQAKTLFTKYINNQCSDKEIELLEAFLDSYQGKENLLNDFKTGGTQDSEKKIWEQIVTQIDTKSTKKKTFPFQSYIMYAAAASVVLFLAVTVFFQKKDTTPAIVNQPIEIGTDKATLTLEDGSAIALEKGKTYNNEHVNSTGEALVYQSDNKSKIEEVVYNYLTIPRGGQFYVELSDGTKVWLNSESKLKYPVTFKKGASRDVELVYGEAYFDVSSSTNHDGASFNVNFKGQHIEVLGTEFNVKAYQDETTTFTTLVEGEIALSANNQKEILQPNQQATVSQSNENIAIKVVDVYNEISWKDGVFSFKRKTLNQIMKVISRWYDVNVVFENKALETTTFRGALGKDQSIQDIMDSIKNASIISVIEIKNKTIYIK